MGWGKLEEERRIKGSWKGRLRKEKGMLRYGNAVRVVYGGACGAPSTSSQQLEQNREPNPLLWPWSKGWAWAHGQWVWCGHGTGECRWMDEASQYHCVSALSRTHNISSHPPFHNASKFFFLTWLQNLSPLDFKASAVHRPLICKNLVFDLSLLFDLCLSLAYLIPWDGNEMLWEHFLSDRFCPQSSCEWSSSVHPHALYSQATCMVPACQLCLYSGMNQTLPSLGHALSGVCKKSVKVNNLLKQVL